MFCFRELSALATQYNTTQTQQAEFTSNITAQLITMKEDDQQSSALLDQMSSAVEELKNQGQEISDKQDSLADKLENMGTNISRTTNKLESTR